MKVLIFSASTGGGHKRAAAALKEYIETHRDKVEVKITDGLALTGKLYNQFICGGYTFLAKRAPRFYGTIYKSSDRKSWLNSLCNNLNVAHDTDLLTEIEAYEPDVIISCHSFVTTMLGNLKKNGDVTVPVIALITDFKAHFTYVAEGVDYYIVSSEEMVDDMANRYGVKRERIFPFGIPVFGKFSAKADAEALRREIGLSPDRPTILFMAGSFGVNEVLKVYRDIENKVQNCQFIVITGNNQHLYRKFRAAVNERTKLLMFVNNVEDYMHCSDIIITKPGGLTVSESLQCGLPMAIYSAFPGQEADNAEYLVRNGVATLLGKRPGDKVFRMVNEKQRLIRMRERCREICPGNSSGKILEFIESIV